MKFPDAQGNAAWAGARCALRYVGCMSAFVLVFVILGPLAIGGLCGWRGGYDGPRTPGAFLKSCGFAIAWSAALVFVWHVLWLASASDAGMAGVAVEGGFWTLVSGLLWLPVLVVLYILRAQKRLKE